MASVQTRPGVKPPKTPGNHRAIGVAVPSRWKRFASKYGPRLLLLPSGITTAVFIYGFIAFTVVVSISNWNNFAVDLSLRKPWYGNYSAIFKDPPFQAALRNMVVFTVAFVVFTVTIGLALALLIQRVGRASAFFRNLFLFPYSLSFIVSGVIWRWLFNPQTGLNLLFTVTGVGPSLQKAGLGSLRPDWLTNPAIVGNLNSTLLSHFHWAAALEVQLGIPVALIPVIIASCWQYAGFAMAFFLAALGGVPQELYEAAHVDGASWWQTQRRIALPLIRPAFSGVIIILLFSSLKIFDLVVAMSGDGPGFATIVPGLYVYQQLFSAQDNGTGAAAAVIMMILVGAVAVPYLTASVRRKEVL